MIEVSEVRFCLDKILFPQIHYRLRLGEDGIHNPEDDRYADLLRSDYDLLLLYDRGASYGLYEYQINANSESVYDARLEQIIEGVDKLKDFIREDPCEVPHEIELWTKYFNHTLEPFVKKKPRKIRQMNFYSIVPKERLPFSEVEVSKIKKFCEKFFLEKYRANFEKLWYVVECGKFKENPNLHIHALILFKQGKSGNFTRDLASFWRQMYPDPKFSIEWTSDTGVGIHNVKCSTQEIIDDKIKYMENDHKGSHQNFKDLEISGSF